MGSSHLCNHGKEFPKVFPKKWKLIFLKIIFKKENNNPLRIGIINNFSQRRIWPKNY